MPNSALPPHMRKNHDDWIFPFSLIPRGWTSYKFFQPPITLLKHNCTNYQEYKGMLGLHPIQRKLNGKFCSWHFNFPFFFSISFTWGWYFIIGCRWDAVDFYYNLITLDISWIGRFEK